MNPHDGETSTASDPANVPEPDAPAAPDTAVTESSATVPESDEAVAPLDLEHIGRDLDGVEAALRRLDDGSYWTDEVTGDELPDELLEADPVARRVEG